MLGIERSEGVLFGRDLSGFSSILRMLFIFCDQKTNQKSLSPYLTGLAQSLVCPFFVSKK